MSETPRPDESPEYRDPTAPSDPPSAASDEPTQQVPTSGDTQHLPPPGPQDPYGAPPPSPHGSTEASRSPYGATPPPPPPPPQNPYGSPAPPQNPYGPPPPSGQNPYGSPQQQYPSQGQVAGGGYGPGYAAPPVQYAPPRSMSGNTIALLVVSALTTLGCGFGIVALVFAIIAATKTQQPAEQAKFTRWGWWAFGIGFLLAVAVIVVVIAIAVTTSGSSSSTGY